MGKVLIVLIIGLLNFSCFGQKLKPIIRTQKYSQEISSGSDSYVFLGGYFIDPEKKGIINLKSLEKGINEIIADVDYSGYVVLNIENRVYQELRSNSIDHENYSKNISMMVKATELVKQLRPNSKVIIYNIPFRFNSANQRKFNDFEKLYPLLNVVDAFAPSLYIHYTENQKDNKYLKNYISNNLDLNFEYAERLNKKVFPFIWYRIHPSNNDYGGSVIKSKQYFEYLKLIKCYRYKNERVEKVIYWEPAEETLDINRKLKETIDLLDKM